MKRLYRQQHLVDFMAVVMQFTRIKIKWSFFSDEAPDLKRACWAFPLAGWLLGLIAGGLGQILILSWIYPSFSVVQSQLHFVFTLAAPIMKMV